MEPNRNNPQNDNGKRNQNFMAMAALGMVVLFVMTILTRSLGGGQSQEITYPEFEKLVETREVVEVVLDEYYNKVSITVKSEDGNSEEKYYTAIVSNKDLKQLFEDHGIENYKGTILERTSWLMEILIYIIPVFLILIIFNVMMRKGGGGGIMGVGKSNAKVYMQQMCIRDSMRPGPM